jgi:IS605 OrfB family transposase
VKQVIVLKLDPTPEQHAALLATLEAFNAAANFVASAAFEQHTASKFALQKQVYRRLREEFGLSAQMAIRAIAKACEAYKRDKQIQPRFKSHGAMVYDERIFAFKGLTHLSLLTLSGRVLVPFRFGAYQACRLSRARGQADLMLRDGTFYLSVTLDLPTPPPIETEGVLGVDLGIVNIATDSDGNTYSSRHLNALRHRHRRLRKKLSAKFTGSARRRFNRRKRKERRFAKQTNHCLSKEIVARAVDTKRAVALEELTHIRTRSTVRRSQRATFSSWAFAQLRQFIAYKAEAAGVRVVLVDPRNSSRTCPACLHVDKANRQSQSKFLCKSCGCTGPADYFAALEIQRRAASKPA